MQENDPGLEPIPEDARLDTLDERLRRARYEEAVRSGERMWREYFARLLTCEKTGTWPGYVEGACLLDMPDVDALTLEIEGEEITL